MNTELDRNSFTIELPTTKQLSKAVYLPDVLAKLSKTEKAAISCLICEHPTILLNMLAQPSEDKSSAPSYTQGVRATLSKWFALRKGGTVA